MKKKQRKKVKLALGCGGARGMAHIGVIEMLEKEGFEISEVVGCSMGAVIGGLYCAGQLDTFKDWLLKQDYSSIHSFFDFTLTRKGILKGDKIFQEIAQVVGEQKIENFKVPFTAVAMDLIKMEEVHLNSGNLYDALRASTSVPGLFVPLIGENTLLVDGGVVNPLPLNLIEKERDTVVIAVDINGKPSFESVSEKNDHSFHLSSIVTDVLSSFEASNSSAGDLPFWGLVGRSYFHTLRSLTQLTIQMYKPDIVVEIPWDSCNTFDFYRSEEIIELGRKMYLLAAKEKRPKKIATNINISKAA